jgi:hypothetical protein
MLLLGIAKLPHGHEQNHEEAAHTTLQEIPHASQHTHRVPSFDVGCYHKAENRKGTGYIFSKGRLREWDTSPHELSNHDGAGVTKVERQSSEDFQICTEIAAQGRECGFGSYW